MPIRTRLYRWFTALVGGVFLALNLALPAAQAGMIGTETLVEQQRLAQQKDELRQFLDRADVRDQLIAWGVDPAAAQARVNSLNAEETALMAQRMQELPAGGDVLGALVFVFLVLLVTDILGLTEVFPFVRGPDER